MTPQKIRGLSTLVAPELWGGPPVRLSPSSGKSVLVGTLSGLGYGGVEAWGREAEVMG